MMQQATLQAVASLATTPQALKQQQQPPTARHSNKLNIGHAMYPHAPLQASSQPHGQTSSAQSQAIAHIQQQQQQQQQLHLYHQLQLQHLQTLQNLHQLNNNNNNSQTQPQPQTHNRSQSQLMSAPGSIFARRADFEAFGKLPRNKVNSYHIKMEDDGSHGNEELRWFILSNLSANKVNKTNCIFCKQSLTIYDRYPLIEGTFFLSPVKHDQSAVPLNTNITPNITINNNNNNNNNNNSSTINNNQHQMFINSVCMSCLEGWSGSIICRFCGVRWNGSQLVLGSVYMFDIIASQPCCKARLTCNNCLAPTKIHSKLQQSLHTTTNKPSLHVFNYFSHYSQRYKCENCDQVDHHYVKPVSSIFFRL